MIASIRPNMNKTELFGFHTYPASMLIAESVILNPEESSSPSLEGVLWTLEQIAFNDNGSAGRIDTNTWVCMHTKWTRPTKQMWLRKRTTKQKHHHLQDEGSHELVGINIHYLHSQFTITTQTQKTRAHHLGNPFNFVQIEKGFSWHQYSMQTPIQHAEYTVMYRCITSSQNFKVAMFCQHPKWTWLS